MLQRLWQTLTSRKPVQNAIVQEKPPVAALKARPPSFQLLEMERSLRAAVTHLPDSEKQRALSAMSLPDPILTVLTTAGIQTVQQICEYPDSLAALQGLGYRRLKELIVRFDGPPLSIGPLFIGLPDHALLDTLIEQLAPAQHDIPFAYFPMSTRLTNVLSNCQIRTPGDLIERAAASEHPRKKTSSAFLLHTPNVGRNSVRELCQVVEKMLAVSGSIPVACSASRSNDQIAR
jgi:hypothetical protein